MRGATVLPRPPLDTPVSARDFSRRGHLSGVLLRPSALRTDDETLVRYWSLDDDDRRLIETRRRDDTRLGLALQLCVLRYASRLLQRGEVIPGGSLGFFRPSSLGSIPRCLRISDSARPRDMSSWPSCGNTTSSPNCLIHCAPICLLSLAGGVASTKDKVVTACPRDAPAANRHPALLLERLAARHTPRPRKPCSPMLPED
ncbi:hypothetical protein J2Z50_003301 [Ensifer mexicanus]|nr:hypothetical protein [Sinorhizobium mexicanum]